MKKMKYLSLLAALVLGITALAGVSSYAEDSGYPEELRVGHTTITKGDFFTEMFGNNTSDIDVRALIHGYNLVNWDQNQGIYRIDESVVRNVQVYTDTQGNRKYELELYDDLYYCDGTQITAWDYAFSLLLMMSPEIEQIGGKIYRCEHILGYDDYITRKVPYLSGVGVLDDYRLSVTLDHEFLPYFFETGLLLCVPYPIREIAPGCRVYAGDADETESGYGYGIRIGNEDASVSEPVYTAELLRKTILDPDTGYNSHPAVTSGPYKLTDYDYETARFEINEYFKGAWMYNNLPAKFRFNAKKFSGVGSGTVIRNSNDGTNIYVMERDDGRGPLYLVKPTIGKISLSLAVNDTMAEDLASGKFHLINKAAYGPAILDCLGLSDGGQAGNGGAGKTEILYQNYPRIGLSFLTFTYERPAVHEMEVRQAIAWCMDRDQLTQDYCKGFGKVVNGYYGIEQWEYLICTGQLDYPIHFVGDHEHSNGSLEKMFQYTNTQATSEEEYTDLVSEWKKLNLNNLTDYNVYDLKNDPDRTEKTGIEKANALLDGAGWTLNRGGETFRPGTDDVRCKKIGGELVPLDLTLMYPRGNHIADTIRENFIDNLAEAGIKLTLVPEEMEELLKSYYREKDRTSDMIYLATNFHVVVDPSITYSTDPTAGHLIWNNTYSDDEELWNLAVDMRKTEPDDAYNYVKKWVAFQERYNEVLPAIPVYSNIYYDFYSGQLQNYFITAHVTWSQAILSAYFGE